MACVEATSQSVPSLSIHGLAFTNDDAQLLYSAMQSSCDVGPIGLSGSSARLRPCAACNGI